MSDPSPLPNVDPTHLPIGWLRPTWRDGTAPGMGQVVACMTGRAGGVSQGPWSGFNLGDHVGDAPEAVGVHRQTVGHLMATLGAAPNADAEWPVAWLQQVHGVALHRLQRPLAQSAGLAATEPVRADGVFTTEPGLVCAVMVADCLPVLLADRFGRGVAALHAGWRGLAGAPGPEVSPGQAGVGILEVGVHALCEATGGSPADLQAWLGPCIGPAHFQVGAEVLLAFGADPEKEGAQARFRPDPSTPMTTAGRRWLADLPGLATDRLRCAGVVDISGGDWCTVTRPEHFYSYRRDGVTGRQAALIALKPPGG